MAAEPAPRRRLPTRPARLAATLAWLAVLACAAWVAIDIVARQNVLSSSGQDLTTALALAGLGFLIARRRPGNPIGWLVLSCAIGLPLTGAASPYVDLAYRHGHRVPFGPVALLVGSAWILPLAALATAILLFPDGRLPSPRWRWALRAAVAAVACLLGSTYAVVLGEISGHRVRLDASGGLAAVDHPAGWFAAVNRAILPVLAACLLSFVAAQALSWQRSGGERRQQLKWLLAGAVGFLFGGIVLLPVSTLDPTAPALVTGSLQALNTLGFVALPACMAVAILKYRLYDIDRIISRTLAYAILTSLLVGAYAGVVLLATQVLQFRSSVSVAVATLVAAALFNPLRRRVQDAVDRRFNRARYDADQAIAAFAGRLKDAVDLDEIRADLEPEHASVWIRRAGS
jgi:hypothetical protein